MHVKNSSQRGLTLIESMIALLVISVGLLGIAALNLTSMQQHSSALHHSKAVWVGYNMADRIRANVTRFGDYAGIDTDNSYSQDCNAGDCTTGQLVTSDAEQWARKVRGLPGGRGMVSGDATRLVVRVMWDDVGTGATGTNCGSDPQVDLTCYSITLVM